MLRPLQRLLEVIYDVPTSHDVEDFVFTDRALLPQAQARGPSQEQVLVSDGAGSAQVGVFLEAALLERLAAANPLHALNGGNLADFWTVLEGISHFQYLAWNARHARPVSVLELELQAEVDKFVVTLWLLRAQRPERYPRELRWLLFDAARVDPAHAGERWQLYRTANHYAARYCNRLERDLASGQRGLRSDAVRDLRRFYRRGSLGKRRHIERLN